MKITPVIVGSGRAGHAIMRSLTVLAEAAPDWSLGDTYWVKRGEPLASLSDKFENPLLVIANPHGLHATTLLAADKAGFSTISCEKPICVNEVERQALENLQAKVAVLHVYRQTWGLQTLRQMVSAGEFGDVLAIEGRYWQSSAAEKATTATPEIRMTPTPSNWKNDIALSGPHDVFLDIATHWADAASFLMGDLPHRAHGWRSYGNAEAIHRDTHVQLSLDFANGARALGSISKTFHGAGNHFEMHVIGSRQSGSWVFQNPDEIVIGLGRNRRVCSRATSDLGSRQSPQHGMGWIEGYIEIHRQLLAEAFLNVPRTNYPRLSESLALMKVLFATEWQNSQMRDNVDF